MTVTDDGAGEREAMRFDVVIVGAGVAGLSAAIRLKQLAGEAGRELSVVVLEKGSEVGAHVLSGAIIDPVGLDRLLPDWRQAGAPLATKVSEEKLAVLGAGRRFPVPAFLLPRRMKHKGCFVGSLGALTRWLGEQASGLGVEIYPGFAASELLYDDKGAVSGVATPDQGLDRSGQPTEQFMRGMELRGAHVLIAEGARGYLARQVIARFRLDEGRAPPRHALGLKELWQVPPAQHRPGRVEHFTGWPLPRGATGGGFLYHYGDSLVALGLVIHADYRDPSLSPFDLLQDFKAHPSLRPLFAGGKQIGYGARTISTGGVQSLPGLTFPGGMLLGCSAGLFNMARLQGVHNAMASGMAAADCCFQHEGGGRPNDSELCYRTALAEQGVLAELETARNVKPLLARFGPLLGGGLAVTDQWSRQIFGKGLPRFLFLSAPAAPADRESLEPPGDRPALVLGKSGADKAPALQLAGVYHDENQPPHLRFDDPHKQLANVRRFGVEPAQFYCPAGVYELRENEQGSAFVHISPANCLHCKLCDLKDPADNLKWHMPPSGGPTYVDM